MERLIFSMPCISFNGPAGARWAALFLGADFSHPSEA